MGTATMALLLPLVVLLRAPPFAVRAPIPTSRAAAAVTIFTMGKGGTPVCLS